MTATPIAPNQSNLLTVLRSFLLAILPVGIEVVEGQQNRVSEPVGPDFVVMTPILQNRISTNVDTYADCAFTASITGTVMTVTAVKRGAIAVGRSLFGVNLAIPSTVMALGTGTGGVGTYTITPSQTVASGTVSAGTELLLQATQVTVQIDVHGPNSADNAQTISTIFRDDYGVQLFAASGFDIVPLYADDPKQIPFTNAEQQIEFRYVIDAVLQSNQIVQPSQQFADQVVVNPISVIEYPL